MDSKEKVFLVRVELHDAEPSDYDTLHLEMEKEGFEKDIRSEGKDYYLPTAEYIKKDNHTIENVLASAKKAATKTKIKYSILVAECSEIIGCYLSPMEKF